MYIEVYDKENKKQLGGFYADLYPREDKRDGGWMDQISYGDIDKGIPNTVVLKTNINKPICDKSALISHNDFSTVFHEFCHCLHGMFFQGKIKLLSSLSVPWDFFELPSQFHENYVWERAALDLFASHYETNEKIHDILFNKMIAARNYQSVITFIYQLYFGRIDLAVHQECNKYKEMEPNDVDDVVSKTYRVPYNEPYYSMYNNFDHLFSRFQKEGILNPATGMSFRKEIL